MAVDHNTIDYPSFRRNFYIEVPDIKRMDESEVATLRKELDGIKVRLCIKQLSACVAMCMCAVYPH